MCVMIRAYEKKIIMEFQKWKEEDVNDKISEFT